AARRRLDRGMLLLVGALGAWAGYLLIAPKPVLPSLGRFVGLGLAAPTATRIELRKPSSRQVNYLDRPLELEVAVRGRPVDAVLFERLELPAAGAAPGSAPSSGGGAEVLAQLPMDRLPGGVLWRLRLSPNELAARLAFRVRAGDAVLAGELHLQPRPEVLRW